MWWRYCSVNSPCYLNINKYEKYYFLKENLEVKCRKNKDSLVDYNNILIGNVFKTEEEITEEDKERLASVINLLKRKRPLFTSKITEESTFEELRKVIETKKTSNLQLEKSHLNNILKKASFL